MNAATSTDEFTVESNVVEAVEPPKVDNPPPQVDKAADSDPGEVDNPEPDERTDDEKAASEAGRTLAGKKKSYQERINELTAKQREAERRAEAAERRARDLEAGAKPKTEEPQAAEPKADAEPTPEQFESFELWVKAHNKWAAREVAREELRAARAHDERSAADRAYRDAQTRVEAKGTEKHADFVEKLTEFAQTGGKFNPFVSDVILTEDNGHEIAYVLATEPETLQAIQSAPTLAKASLLMGKLLARLEAAESGPAPKAPAVTHAKPPIKPVGSSPVTSDEELPDDLSVDEHIRRMNARDKAARRR